MKNRRILFFDVDTQKDFIEPDGALYVPAAETLKPTFKQMILYARTHEIPIWGSVDAHTEQDQELSRNNGPFPDHCMQGSPGQQKIPETAPPKPLWIKNRTYSEEELQRAMKHTGEIYFEKQTYNMFDNPNLSKMVTGYDPVIIFGVATDYCVLAAALGFRKLDKAVFVVEDAIKPVSSEGEQKALKEIRESGANFIKTDAISDGLLFRM